MPSRFIREKRLPLRSRRLRRPSHSGTGNRPSESTPTTPDLPPQCYLESQRKPTPAPAPPTANSGRRVQPPHQTRTRTTFDFRVSESASQVERRYVTEGCASAPLDPSERSRDSGISNPAAARTLVPPRRAHAVMACATTLTTPDGTPPRLESADQPSARHIGESRALPGLAAACPCGDDLRHNANQLRTEYRPEPTSSPATRAVPHRPRRWPRRRPSREPHLPRPR